MIGIMIEEIIEEIILIKFLAYHLTYRCPRIVSRRDELLNIAASRILTH